MPQSPSSTPKTLDHTNYRIGRGETGVLTYEPYKSALLPSWRFRTPAIAQTSTTLLWEAFLKYEKDNDFVGMDMTRKFLQMGMTRAKRYANHKGGKKYKPATKDVIEVGVNDRWKGREEKAEASAIFKEVWERARDHEQYQEMKQSFLKRQKEWDRDRSSVKGAPSTETNSKSRSLE